MSSLLNLISNIETNLNNPLLYTKLTLDEINYINTLLQAESSISNNSGIITQIQNEFDNIIKDGVISLHDIPEIILLITDILKTNIIKNTIQNVGIINIIEFILNSLFDSNIFPLNSSEIILIKTLVNSSLQLLQTNIDFVIKEEETFCTFLQGIHFGYCSHWSLMDMKHSGI
jgi:hypothetical protein